MSDNHPNRSLPAFSAIVLLAAAGLGCAPRVDIADIQAGSEPAEARAADSVSLASVRAWGAWRVECHADRSIVDGAAIYRFSPASAAELAGLERIKGRGTKAGPGFWVDDTSWSCPSKGFYAQPDGDGLAPATMSYDAGAEKSVLLSTRLWNGMRVDCLHDTAFWSRGQDYYRFQPATPEEARSLRADHLASPRAVGSVGARPLYWIHDSSLACGAKGFYASKDPQGMLSPVGLAFGYDVSSGKTVHRAGAAQIVEDASGAIVERLAARRAALAPAPSAGPAASPAR